jgi:hypothetical protein
VPGPGGIIVHFGMPKTGSTSIQQSLYRHLSDARFHYVDLGAAPANYAMATGFRADPSRFHVHRKLATPAGDYDGLRHAAQAQLAAQLEKAGPRTALLSAESLANFKKPELESLCGALRRQRSSITFAGYVRRPKAFMESEFQQRIRAGQSQLEPARLVPNYRRKLEKFDQLGGRDRTHIWLFDPAAFPAGDAVQDFCGKLGIDFSPRNVVRSNESLSRDALSLLYAYRRLGPGYGTGPAAMRENRLLIHRLRSLEGAKLRFHSSLVAPLLEAQRADHAWMESRLGASLAEDVAADDAQGVRDEGDLLSFSPAALRWLEGELGAQWRAGDGAQAVAEGMHLLRLSLALVGTG